MFTFIAVHLELPCVRRGEDGGYQRRGRGRVDRGDSLQSITDAGIWEALRVPQRETHREQRVGLGGTVSLAEQAMAVVAILSRSVPYS